ncbi:hypothetical protein ACQW02_24095 [Humitalea sp. 24SJ18S-53]|uniref:hypothetical protein n=1 Tax=Humitalea sp. 24SJ18S-53 TaxID=3422307 RepID=UPI003D6674F0
MKIGYEDSGEAFVTAYEPGDMVLLKSDETGPYAFGRAGDWGRVTAFDARTGLTSIAIAGYSQPKGGTLASLSDIPRRILQPCDKAGVPVPLKRHIHMALPGRGRL